MTNLNAVSCLACGATELCILERFQDLPRITSDCKPFSVGGTLGVCSICGFVQKPITPEFVSSAEAIYADYQAYSVAGGSEQLVLVEGGGTKKRSDRLISRMLSAIDLPAGASVLDVGCGHGVTLEALSACEPSLNLFGLEIDDSKRKSLEAVPGFRQLYTGSIADIDYRFDLLTMIHSLEHFFSPLTFLDQSRHKISAEGYLFIQVCNVAQNPFDLLVADHVSHFSPQTLAILLENAGYRVLSVFTDWVTKEISALARPSGVGTEDRPRRTRLDLAEPGYASESVENQLDWLIDIRVSLSQNFSGVVGIFGTSIAGTWIASILDKDFSFWVDDDPLRIGQSHLGRPVLGLANVPANATLIMGVAPVLASKLVEKHAPRRPDIRFIQM